MAFWKFWKRPRSYSSVEPPNDQLEGILTDNIYPYQHSRSEEQCGSPTSLLESGSEDAINVSIATWDETPDHLHSIPISLIPGKGLGSPPETRRTLLSGSNTLQIPDTPTSVNSDDGFNNRISSIPDIVIISPTPAASFISLVTPTDTSVYERQYDAPPPYSDDGEAASHRYPLVAPADAQLPTEAPKEVPPQLWIFRGRGWTWWANFKPPTWLRRPA